MLILLLPIPLLDVDATVRAAVVQSVQANVTSFRSASLLTGGEIDADARAGGPRSLYTSELHGHYARAFDVALGGGAGPPADNLDADGVLTGSWTLSPLTTLTLNAEGSLATTYGVRADTRLLELDPFLFAQRLEYAAGADLALALTPRRRVEVTLEGGYVQEGALAADAAAAVGVDSHEGHAAVSTSVEIGPRDTLTPELRYTRLYFEHALLDADLHRGCADIHDAALTVALTHEVSRGFFGTATAGLSLATPMPLLGARGPVLSPDAGLKLRWTGRRSSLTARYTYAYTSLGPRIGFGHQHRALVRLDLRPSEGARGRDLAVRATLRLARGVAPLAADPEPVLPGEPRPFLPANGTLTTTSVAAGSRVDVPFFRGVALTAGVDLTFTCGVVDPEPPGGGARTALRATLSLGFAATTSTDRRRRGPRDPAGEEDDTRSAPGVPDRDAGESQADHAAPSTETEDEGSE
jgi:hypothetical protein